MNQENSVLCLIYWYNRNMITEVKPEETTRAAAFNLWMTSPMPMVTLVKTIDVSKLVKTARKRGLKFNMLLCWCIGKAAGKIEEFYTLPVQGKFLRYDKIAVNVIVQNKNGGINSCDIPFSENPEQFNRDYIELTEKVAAECKSIFNEDYMIVGTSAMIQTELDCIVNQYTDKFTNPMVLWGKYRKGLFKTTLPVSFQFHHVQMDGGHGARFLEELQKVISE